MQQISGGRRGGTKHNNKHTCASLGEYDIPAVALIRVLQKKKA